MTTKPPVPPFTLETAKQKIRAAENAWNSKQPEMIAMAYSENSRWRNRSLFMQGRAAIVDFLADKWQKELEYRLIKELWAYTDNRIAVRFAYEFRDDSGQWYRAYGNENWQFDNNGLMEQRHASINNIEIDADERKFLWAGNTRPEDYPELSELNL